MKTYSVMLRTNDEPEQVADAIETLGYHPIQINQIDESPENYGQIGPEVVWQA